MDDLKVQKGYLNLHDDLVTALKNPSYASRRQKLVVLQELINCAAETPMYEKKSVDKIIGELKQEILDLKLDRLSNTSPREHEDVRKLAASLSAEAVNNQKKAEKERDIAIKEKEEAENKLNSRFEFVYIDELDGDEWIDAEGWHEESPLKLHIHSP